MDNRRPRLKLMALELLSGIFGWAWILAGLVMFYSLVMTIVFGAPWPRIFWALGVSILARGLMEGFRAIHRRADYISNLVAREHTPEGAALAWNHAASVRAQ